MSCWLQGGDLNLNFLSVDEVRQIHEILVKDFEESRDPISPAGVRSEDLLHSAVSRQEVGLGGKLKYCDPIENAATLAFGLCQDHAFFNGNKRTALVAMLVHLDRNHLSLYGVAEKELFGFILKVSNHELKNDLDARLRRSAIQAGDSESDLEVRAITEWIRKRADRLERGERQIRFRELRRILGRFGFRFENPRGGSIDVMRIEIRQVGFWKKRQVEESKRIGSVTYRGENEFVTLKGLKQVRAICRLREEDGVDSVSFYDTTAVLDAFVNRYRTVLRKLARR
jgi:death-on-curing family protein